ncbi:rho GTPase-activating protein 6 isoform X2 [Phlebotomus argentipes]|nr:rho GTPase-activating protein 6 isoform X2 [Phlebotomus argentipes]
MLQRVAIRKLHDLNFGMPLTLEEVGVPSAKENSKRRIQLIKRKSLTTSFFDSGKKKDAHATIFGVALENCLLNEANVLTPPQVHSDPCEIFPPFNMMKSCRHMNQDTSHRVPFVVRACCDHLRVYGLSTVGLFRISPARRRVHQLKEDWQQGGVVLGSSHCPHDVATLLKEFLRDLPEPLLCTRLATAFLSTQQIRNRHLQLEALTYLLALLPPPHSDTLRVLLSFLAEVADAANDAPGRPGNRMNSANLATVFAPNVLRITQLQEDAEACINSVNVMRTLIDHQGILFRVKASIMDQVYLQMMETHGQVLDQHCEWRAAKGSERQRMPTSLSTCKAGVLSATLNLPVQSLHMDDDFKDIPFIEDSSDTVTGNLSLAASRSFQNSRATLMLSKTEDVVTRRYKRREIISSAAHK